LPYIDEEVIKAAQRALSRVHRLGVLHGDISLENMMLVEAGEEGSAANKDGGGGRVSAEESGPRVMIVDLGRSYAGASCEQLDKEMARLRRLLRA
jgi:serine/threonine protein kinase